MLRLGSLIAYPHLVRVVQLGDLKDSRVHAEYQPALLYDNSHIGPP